MSLGIFELSGSPRKALTRTQPKKVHLMQQLTLKILFIFYIADNDLLIIIIMMMWPRCSRFLFNIYQGWATIVLRGTDNFLFSREGVTQGDPLSIFLYAVGTLPLIHQLKKS